MVLISPRTLSTLLSATDAWLEHLLSGRNWYGRVTWICLLVSVVHMVLTNPSCLWFYQNFYQTISSGQEYDAFNVVRAQAATFYTDLGLSHFATTGYESSSHEAKLQFRLVLPAVVATLGLTRISLTIWLIQLVMSAVFVGLAARLAFRLTADRVASFLFVLALSLLYPLRSAWLDITAYGDFFAYLFLLIAIYVRRPLLIGLAVQAAFWTDERAMAGAVFVLLWHGFVTRLVTGTYRVDGQQLAVLVSGALYLLLRQWITLQFGVPSVSGRFLAEFKSTYYENIKLVGFKVWSGFQGAWLLVGAATALLLHNRRFGQAAWLLGLLILTINFSFIVVDMNRAISYSYLALFCALQPLAQLSSRHELRRLLLFTIGSLLICPLPNRLRIVNGIPLM